jgi:hypothetical protein
MVEPGEGSVVVVIFAFLRVDHVSRTQVLHRESYCKLEVPYSYTRQFGSIIGAGPKTYMLGSSPYWYELGIKLAFALPEQCDRIVKMLNSAFVERYVDIFTFAQNFRNEEGAEVKKKYTLLEQRLYQGEYKAATQFERWKDRPVTKLGASVFAEQDQPLAPSIGAGTQVERDAKRLKSGMSK